MRESTIDFDVTNIKGQLPKDGVTALGLKINCLKDGKRNEARKADYKGATPGQVGKAVFKYRPAAESSTNKPVTQDKR